MSSRGLTKDERFLVTLYETAEREGDVFTPINRHKIAKMIGLQERATYTITRSLLQTNFIKKSGEIDVFLTPNGERIVLGILEP